MSTSQLNRALSEEIKGTGARTEAKETLNHYKHLEGKTLAEVSLIATINVDAAPTLVCLNKLDSPVLLIIQPGASTQEQAAKLKNEQKKISEENSGAKCWMNEKGLPGCGGELDAWNKLLYDEKANMLAPACSVMVLNLREPTQQKTVMAEKKLDNMTLLSPQNITDASTLLSQEVGELNGVNYMPRGALLIQPGGKVLKSYDLDANTPSKNPQLIYSFLGEDISKIPKPKPVVSIEETKREPVNSRTASLA
jgi:hypothetical protein